jgi:hypothetical protein
LRTPADADLDRRAATALGRRRARLTEREQIDAPLMQNNNDHMSDDVKYFTDLPRPTVIRSRSFFHTTI